MSSLLDIHEILPQEFHAFRDLMTADDAGAGCWCMRWRVDPHEFESGREGANREGIERRIGEKVPPGLIAFDNAVPVGWVSCAPLLEFPGMVTDPSFSPPKNTGYWVVSCIYVRPGYRRQGISAILIDAASTNAFSREAPAVIGYPADPSKNQPGQEGVYGGTLSAFLSAGFLPDGAGNGGRIRVIRGRDA